MSAIYAMFGDGDSAQRAVNGLRQAGLSPHIAGIACFFCSRGIVRGRRDCPRIACERAFAAVGQDFDNASVRFQSHPKHGLAPALIFDRSDSQS